MELSSLTTRPTTKSEVHRSGESVTALSGPGSLICVGCGYRIPVEALDALPTCPACRGSRFRRGSLFDQPTIDVGAVEVADEAPPWLSEIRERAAASGPQLAFEGDQGPVAIPLEEGWMRIGRSAAADLRLDDPTVSRRHALIVRTAEGELRALDDRSMNGLFVNGERVEWAQLSDGDELEIGRYRIFVVEG